MPTNTSNQASKNNTIAMYYFYFSIAFIVGFSERLDHDIVEQITGIIGIPKKSLLMLLLMKMLSVGLSIVVCFSSLLDSFFVAGLIANCCKKAIYPNCPDNLFQFHHQPFNYYANYAPGTKARKKHLRDEQEFIDLVKSSAQECKLNAVSFIKPIGAENEHPGYASQSHGNKHLVELIDTVESNACAKDTMIIVTYDEFGGQWDHVPPPGQGNNNGPHDQWGPGNRIPALIISPFLQDKFVVDHKSHDTTSIIATIAHRFELKPLDRRDARVNYLSSVFSAKPPQNRLK